MNLSNLVYLLVGLLLGIALTFFLGPLFPSCNYKNALAYETPKITIKQTSISSNYNLNIGSILQKAYPEKIIGYSSDHIIWYDSTLMTIDDSISEKSFEELLNIPDLEDQFHFKYSKGIELANPPKYYDPGRIRNDEFFKKMYGATKEEVEQNLVEVIWLRNYANEKLLATKINGVADKLQLISNELDTMPHLYKYLKNPGGTFNWRYIAGTDRLSPHSYGFTIDINTDYSNYWRWDLANVNTDSIHYINRIPLEIVEIFEKHGFIWGGKWYHYDTMHFEYRPEMMINE